MALRVAAAARGVEVEADPTPSFLAVGRSVLADDEAGTSATIGAGAVRVGVTAAGALSLEDRSGAGAVTAVPPRTGAGVSRISGTSATSAPTAGPLGADGPSTALPLSEELRPPRPARGPRVFEDEDDDDGAESAAEASDDAPSEPEVSAAAMPGIAIKPAPTPRATASTPTRPTYHAGPDPVGGTLARVTSIGRTSLARRCRPETGSLARRCLPLPAETRSVESKEFTSVI